MNAPKSKFPTMGTSAATTAKNASAEGTSGTLMKKTGNAKGGTDPYVQDAPERSNIKAMGGAAYGIRTSMPSYVDPQIGVTQGNGRMFTPAVNRTKPNFEDGMTISN